MHNSAVFVEAVNEDGLVPHEPVPLVDLNLPIPPIPNLVGDDDEVEQVPVPVLTQLAQAITSLARSTAHPTPIPAPRNALCELNFQDCPLAFVSDRLKIIYTQSFLMGMALDRFKPDLLEGLPEGA
ncbi:uncharacterized protein EI90DRAFT_3130962 [Cantharellus anzutake]|uniref:uncharacterized protein n=1 Tax=Cantharellus anzutake TaxID=1750568 RepID=UPI0019050543|nr:uncharacterized protein EI90DRAFT_3130962 [Cantharellus anzutake]KAF8322402.1 hypothetical protein EI90DRAFT_3130962 [Cantharellus anzutake]